MSESLAFRISKQADANIRHEASSTELYAIADEVASLQSALATARREALELRAALKRHHDWHLQSGEIGLPDGKGGWIAMDNAAEYSDSKMCEDTCALLSQSVEVGRAEPRGDAVALVANGLEELLGRQDLGPTPSIMVGRGRLQIAEQAIKTLHAHGWKAP